MYKRIDTLLPIILILALLVAAILSVAWHF
jgi:hypothetical protein